MQSRDRCADYQRDFLSRDNLILDLAKMLANCCFDLNIHYSPDNGQILIGGSTLGYTLRSR